MHCLFVITSYSIHYTKLYEIDGIDVRDATLHSLRKEVGVLMQDPFIFKGTVLDNIRYGKWDATDEES